MVHRLVSHAAPMQLPRSRTQFQILMSSKQSKRTPVGLSRERERTIGRCDDVDGFDDVEVDLVLLVRYARVSVRDGASNL